MLSSTPQLVADATHGINWSVWLSLGANLVALAYGYGVLNARVKAVEKEHETHRQRKERTDDEIFGRLRKIKAVTPRLEDAATRLEKAVGNGLGAKIENITTRLAKLEQHCADLHGRPASPE